MKTDDGRTFSVKSYKALNQWKSIIKKEPLLQETFNEAIKLGSMMETRIINGWASIEAREALRQTNINNCFQGYWIFAILYQCWKYSDRLIGELDNSFHVKLKY